MHIQLLQRDKWVDRQNYSSVTEHPSLGDVRGAIYALDGVQYTLVTLAKDSESYMIIGGKWDGRCMVNATADSRTFMNVIDPSESPEKRILYVGGQDGDYDGRKCVPLSWALRAAETYAQTGELDASLSWEREP